MTTTMQPVDLWRDHQARNDRLPESLDKALENWTNYEMSPMERAALEVFVSQISDAGADLVAGEIDLDRFVAHLVTSMCFATQTFPLFLAAKDLDGLLGDESMGDGVLGHALHQVIDQLSPMGRKHPVWYRYVTSQ